MTERFYNTFCMPWGFCAENSLVYLQMMTASLHGQSRGWTTAGNHNEIKCHFFDLYSK